MTRILRTSRRFSVVALFLFWYGFAIWKLRKPAFPGWADFTSTPPDAIIANSSDAPLVSPISQHANSPPLPSPFLDPGHLKNAFLSTSSWSRKPRSKVGKVSMFYREGSGPLSAAYERAQRGQAAHNALHGHPGFVLERSIVGVWSKQTWMLQVMIQELAKPEEERLEWLLYVG
jgi:hypothetical protein